MAILGCIQVPHPPLIIPEVGRGGEAQIAATAGAYRAAAAWLAGRKPETVAVISPHSAAYQDYIHISPGAGAAGDFGRFGAGGVRIQAQYDGELAERIALHAREAGFPAGTQGGRDASLDHGTLVPLYFLKEAAGGQLPFRIVRIGLSGLSYADHYRLGILIRDAADALGRKLCVAASGDLSHYLRKDGPYGYRAEGPAYDERLMDIMGRAAFGELLGMPEEGCERAGECGQRSFLIMAGCLDGRAVVAKRLSYQGVTGVGYGVCLFEPGEDDPSRRFLEGRLRRVEEARAGEGPYVRLARQSFEQHVRTGARIARPEGLPDEMTQRRAGVFVSLKKDGRLRGCIGTIQPATACIADEIIENAVSAAARDPRFPPVTAEELPYISCSVDVLDEPEDIASPEELDVKEYGVIVSKGGRRGLLLPNLDGVDSVEEQIAIARRKAGIGADEKVSLKRFRVVRHH